MNEIVTSVRVDRLEHFLRISGFDPVKSNTLLKGFREGFDIGYRGPKNRKDRSQNIPISVGSEGEIWDKLLAEVNLGRHAGPFIQPPYDTFIQSPIGLVPKKGNKTRLIFHLSFDFGEEYGKKSVNFHTPKEMCLVKYHDLDYAIKAMLRVVCDSDIDFDNEEVEPDSPQVDHIAMQKSGVDFLNSEAEFKEKFSYKKDKIYLSKTDLQSAFRILPILPFQKRWLLMKAKNPHSGQYMFCR